MLEGEASYAFCASILRSRNVLPSATFDAMVKKRETVLLVLLTVAYDDVCTKH
jgi:hypothetical protein